MSWGRSACDNQTFLLLIRTMRSIANAAAVLALICCTSACSIKTMAVKTIANTLSKSGDTFTRDDDPELIRAAVPFALKTYESLLETVPTHRGLLLATCSGFTQYAFAFVQADADALEVTDYEAFWEQRQRALKMYLRGRGYCLRGLELRARGLEKRLILEPEEALRNVTKDDVPLLYWTAASWGAAIGVGLDRPDLIADVPVVRALLSRALALQEDYARGALHEAMITLEALPAEMGGSSERARTHFMRAVELSKGFNPGPYISLASGVAVAAKDRGEFEKLLDQALAIDPEQDPSNRLPILIAQRRARMLRARVDRLFAPTGQTSGLGLTSMLIDFSPVVSGLSRTSVLPGFSRTSIEGRQP
jgi:predicted anti-sigma-YlaC factor YlaD